MTLDDLVAIEQIKQLKARYTRLMDHKQWDDFVNLFAPDGTMLWDSIVPGADGDGKPFPILKGREAIRSSVSGNVNKGRAVHQVHSPEIIVAGDTATGTWALHDVFHSESFELEAFGYYYEKYVKIDGQWMISELHLRWLTANRIHRGSAAPIFD